MSSKPDQDNSHPPKQRSSAFVGSANSIKKAQSASNTAKPKPPKIKFNPLQEGLIKYAIECEIKAVNELFATTTSDSSYDNVLQVCAKIATSLAEPSDESFDRAQVSNNEADTSKRTVLKALKRVLTRQHRVPTADLDQLLSTEGKKYPTGPLTDEYINIQLVTTTEQMVANQNHIKRAIFQRYRDEQEYSAKMREMKSLFDGVDDTKLEEQGYADKLQKQQELFKKLIALGKKKQSLMSSAYDLDLNAPTHEPPKVQKQPQLESKIVAPKLTTLSKTQLSSSSSTSSTSSTSSSSDSTSSDDDQIDTTNASKTSPPQSKPSTPTPHKPTQVDTDKKIPKQTHLKAMKDSTSSSSSSSSSSDESDTESKPPTQQEAKTAAQILHELDKAAEQPTIQAPPQSTTTVPTSTISRDLPPWLQRPIYLDDSLTTPLSSLQPQSPSSFLSGSLSTGPFDTSPLISSNLKNVQDSTHLIQDSTQFPPFLLHSSLFRALQQLNITSLLPAQFALLSQLSTPFQPLNNPQFARTTIVDSNYAPSIPYSWTNLTSPLSPLQTSLQTPTPLNHPTSQSHPSPFHPNVDICVCSPTGTGKTLAYLLPTINNLLLTSTLGPTQRSPSILIIVPTQPLASQVYGVTVKLLTYINQSLAQKQATEWEQAQKKQKKSSSQAASIPLSSHYPLKVALLSQNQTTSNSTSHASQLLANPNHPYSNLNAVSTHYPHADIIILTPGKTIDLMAQDVTFRHCLSGLNYLIFDECDNILNSPSSLWLVHLVSLISKQSPHRNFTKMLFSATFSGSPPHMSLLSLQKPVYFTFRAQSTVKTIEDKSEEVINDIVSQAPIEVNPESKIQPPKATKPANDNEKEKQFTLPSHLQVETVSCTQMNKPLLLFMLIFYIKFLHAKLSQILAERAKNPSPNPNSSPPSTTTIPKHPGIVIFVSNNDTVHRLRRSLELFSGGRLKIGELNSTLTKHLRNKLIADFQTLPEPYAKYQRDMYALQTQIVQKSTSTKLSKNATSSSTPSLLSPQTILALLTKQQKTTSLSHPEVPYDILICSDIASRGLDLTNAFSVINYDFPQNTATFCHRVGRCARGTNYGLALSLLYSSQFKHYQRMTDEIRITTQPPIQLTAFKSLLANFQKDVSTAQSTLPPISTPSELAMTPFSNVVLDVGAKSSPYPSVSLKSLPPTFSEPILAQLPINLIKEPFNFKLLRKVETAEYYTPLFPKLIPMFLPHFSTSSTELPVLHRQLQANQQNGSNVPKLFTNQRVFESIVLFEQVLLNIPHHLSYFSQGQSLAPLFLTTYPLVPSQSPFLLTRSDDLNQLAQTLSSFSPFLHQSTIHPVFLPILSKVSIKSRNDIIINEVLPRYFEWEDKHPLLPAQFGGNSISQPLLLSLLAQTQIFNASHQTMNDDDDDDDDQGEIDPIWRDLNVFIVDYMISMEASSRKAEYILFEQQVTTKSKNKIGMSHDNTSTNLRDSTSNSGTDDSEDEDDQTVVVRPSSCTNGQQILKSTNSPHHSPINTPTRGFNDKPNHIQSKMKTQQIRSTQSSSTTTTTSSSSSSESNGIRPSHLTKVTKSTKKDKWDSSSGSTSMSSGDDPGSTIPKITPKFDRLRWDSTSDTDTDTDTDGDTERDVSIMKRQIQTASQPLTSSPFPPNVPPLITVSNEQDNVRQISSPDQSSNEIDTHPHLHLSMLSTKQQQRLDDQDLKAAIKMFDNSKYLRTLEFKNKEQKMIDAFSAGKGVTTSASASIKRKIDTNPIWDQYDDAIAITLKRTKHQQDDKKSKSKTDQSPERVKHGGINESDEDIVRLMKSKRKTTLHVGAIQSFASRRW